MTRNKTKINNLKIKHAISKNVYEFLFISLIVFCGILGVAENIFASVYYVRTDGNNSNNGSANSPSQAWKTVEYASHHVSAGDTIRIQEGIYEEQVTPGINGSGVDSTVTFVADGNATVCGFQFNNSSYIRLIGLVIDSNAGDCTRQSFCVIFSGQNNYLEFWNNTLQDASANGFRMASAPAGTYYTVNKSIFIGNDLSNFGISNYSGVGVSVVGDGNLIAYNELHDIDPDAFSIASVNTRYLNNYFHDVLEQGGGHPDMFQTGSKLIGWHDNLFEANFQAGAGNLGNEHTAQISHSQAATYCPGGCGAMTENIFRRNVWHNVSGGTIGINQVYDGPITFVRYYNNTIVQTNRNPGASNSRSNIVYYNFTSGLVNDMYMLNNLEYEGWGSSATNYITVYSMGSTGNSELDLRYAVDYNLGYDPDGSVSFAAPFSTQSHGRLNSNPRLTDLANDDFHLQSDSGAKEAAGPLTATMGSGTGTTFNVASSSGGFFRGDDFRLRQYEGKLAAGDTITVGNDVVIIASISGDEITAATPFSWEDGEKVYFGSSATPDIGAFPYKASYNLNGTWSKSGNALTIVPNDASLVRFAVVYENGIPMGVADSAPYIVNSGGGAVEVRLYGLYASKTPVVKATQINSDYIPPIAPSGLSVY